MKSGHRGWMMAALSGTLLVSAACRKPSAPEVGQPMPGLTTDERARFEEGGRLFQQKFTPETGLGPLFN